MVFMLPMLRSVALPGIVLRGALFMFVRLGPASWHVGRLVMRLLPFSAVSVFPVPLVVLCFVSFFTSMRLLSVRGLLRR
jgi:hypothetical protein